MASPNLQPKDFKGSRQRCLMLTSRSEDQVADFQGISSSFVSKIVSERLGHSSVATTMDIYSHVLPGMQEEAALAVERKLNRS